MFDSHVVLIAGGLMALALLASFLAARIRVPGLVLFLARRDAGRLGRPGLDRVRATTSSRATIGSRAGADPLRGRPRRGLLRDPPGAAPGDRAGRRGHHRDRGDHRAGRGLAARPLDARGHAARLDRRLDRRARRSSPCCAARRCGGGWRERWRARPGFNDPVAVAARDRVHRLDPAARLRRGRHGRAVRERARDRRRRRACRRRGWRCWGCSALQLASPGLYPVASITAAALAFGLADFAHGSGFLAVYLDRADARIGRIPAKRSIVTFHEGLAWVAQLVMFLTLGLLVFPSRARRRRARGHGPRPASSRSSRGRPRRSWPPSAPASRWPSGRRARLGGPARRDPGRARHVPGDRRRRREHRVSSTSSSSRCCVSTAAPGHDVRAARARGSGVTTSQPGAAPAADRDRHDPARSAPRSSSTRSRPDDAAVGAPRARPRAAARRADQRDRARRQGAPAAGLDPARGRRPRSTWSSART